MHWPRVFRAAIQHDDLPFLASPLECCDCVADFARRGPYSLCASRRMVFNAPQRDLTLSLYKIRKGLSSTCSQRIEVSRRGTCARNWSMDLRGHYIRHKVTCLCSAISCSLAQCCNAVHTRSASHSLRSFPARHRQFRTSYDRMSLEHHYSR